MKKKKTNNKNMKKKKAKNKTKKQQYTNKRKCIKKQKGGTKLTIDKQNEIFILYDLYKLISSIIEKFIMEVPNGTMSLYDFILTYKNKKYMTMFQSKGFTFENCIIIEDHNEKMLMIEFDPLLFSLKDNQTETIIHLLNIAPGHSSNTFKYYEASKQLYNNVIDYIINIDKLYIIGHSSGSALALSFINTYYELSKEYIDIYCITTGLGKCDSYLLDIFEHNLQTHSIEYYDLLNMMGEPYDESCWGNYFIDDRILKTTCSSMYSFNVLNKSEIEIDFSEIYSKKIKDNIIEFHKILHGEFTTDQIPPNYDKYHKILLSKLDKHKNDSCFETNTLFDCQNISKLFNRHLTTHTYAIINDSYRYSILIEYNKNTLLNTILNNGKWIIDNNGLRILLTNNEITMCFNGTIIGDYYGAHTLKSYYTQLITDNK